MYDNKNQIQISNNVLLGRNNQNNKLQKSLKSGFNDVREIIDGKQERTTIDEFINELRNSSN